MSFNEIFEKIKEKGFSEEKIHKMINEKIEEFSGLLTREGAIYLIAKDLGIEIENYERRLQIKNVVAGMKSVNILGRVLKIFPMKEFYKGSRKGRVMNLILGDETGCLRVVLWNEKIELAENLREGDLVQIRNAFSKENIFGDIELSLGRFGSLDVVEGIDFPSYEELYSKYFSFNPKRVFIKDLELGNFEIRGTIVKIFRSKFLFEDSGEMVAYFSCLLDDTTSSIRVIFFRDNAEKLIGMKSKELEILDENERFFEINSRVLGKEIIVGGKVKKNNFTDKLEMISSYVKDINYLEESKQLLEEIEKEI